MSLLRWTIVLVAITLGLSACAVRELLRERVLPPASSTQTPAATSPIATENVAAAQQLAREATALTQRPYDPASWKTARVKWRQAIRIMEAIPPLPPVSVKPALSRYQQQYAAVTQRLAVEEQAATQLESAQALAWQAAVLVQNPPHPLRIWQRAYTKRQTAIAQLEAIPRSTAVSSQSRAKLAVYRAEQQTIQQRIQTEKQAQAVLQQFSATAKSLSDLSTQIVSGLMIEQIGIRYSEYVSQVQQLETMLDRFSSQLGGVNHPMYADLAAAVSDYRFALKLWDEYLRYKQANSKWLYGDLFNQMVPVSWLDRAILLQRYELQPYSNNRFRVSLRLSVWQIWQHAADQVNAAQSKLEQLNRIDLAE